MEQLARDRFMKQHPIFFGLIPSLEDTMFVQEAAINNDHTGRLGLNYILQFSANAVKNTANTIWNSKH